MTYKIISAVENGATLNTQVEYTFDDDSTVLVDIPHFMPEDKDAVILGIENRGASEDRNRLAKIKNQDIASDINGEKEGSVSSLGKAVLIT